MCTNFRLNCSRRSRILKYFFNTFLYFSATKGGRITLSLQLPLWAVGNMCTDFGTNCSRRSEIFFLTTFLYISAPKGVWATLCLQFTSLVVMCVPILVQIAPCVPEF